MAYSRPQDLPNFLAPPVQEVEFALAFHPAELGVTRIGQFIEALAGSFPIVSEARPRVIKPVRLGVAEQGLRLNFMERPPLPRINMSSVTSTREVSVQSDALVWRWQEGPGDPYPGYGDLRGSFAEVLDQFDRFTDLIEIENIYLRQLHIKYSNLVVVEAGSNLEALSTVLRPASNDSGALGGLLPDQVGVTLQKSYLNADDLAYAVLDVEASASVEPQHAGHHSVVTDLTYSGNPFFRLSDRSGVETSEIVEFLDEGHDEIVRTFAGLTRPQYHSLWEREA